MAGYPNPANISAYKSVAAHSTALDADPHKIITMLIDGALDRLGSAKGSIERGEIAIKAGLLHRVGAIIDELRSSLDHSAGGEISGNLERLYDYMMGRVITANLKNDVGAIEEVARLLRDVREAWVSIPPQQRSRGK